MDLGLRDATVVVNGGSKGKQALDETVAALLELGASDAVPLPADITDAQQVTGAFGIIEERWGILNVLVNASGPVDVGVGRFAAVDDAEWAATFDVGTIGAVRCVRAALPLLRAAAWARTTCGTRCG